MNQNGDIMKVLYGDIVDTKNDNNYHGLALIFPNTVCKLLEMLPTYFEITNIVDKSGNKWDIFTKIWTSLLFYNWYLTLGV